MQPQTTGRKRIRRMQCKQNKGGRAIDGETEVKPSEASAEIVMAVAVKAVVISTQAVAMGKEETPTTESDMNQRKLIWMLAG